MAASATVPGSGTSAVGTVSSDEMANTGCSLVSGPPPAATQAAYTLALPTGAVQHPLTVFVPTRDVPVHTTSPDVTGVPLSSVGIGLSKKPSLHQRSVKPVDLAGGALPRDVVDGTHSV